MDSDSTITLIFLVVAGVAFFGSHAAEAALPLLRRSHMRERVPEHSLQQTAMRHLRLHRTVYEDLIYILRLAAIAAVFPLALALSWVQGGVTWGWTLLAMSALWVGLIVLRGLAVRVVAGLSDDGLLWMAVPLHVLLRPALPLARLTGWMVHIGRAVREPANGNGSAPAEQDREPEASLEEIASEPLEPEERRMIHGILHLEDTAVREIMVPRVDVVAIEASVSLDQAIDRMLKAGHSRAPVYQDTLDSVVGILYTRDLLEVVSRNGAELPTLSELVRGPFFVPESKHADELLREFQERHTHMAIVVDEYGGVAGIITIEDLIEEIVGEIEDEFDANEPTIERDEEGNALVDARMEVDAFNETFHAAISGEGFETLGGFLYDRLGKIPSPGDVVTTDGLRVEVVTTTGKRIRRVRVIPHAETSQGSP